MTLTHTLAVIQVADIGEHGMILSKKMKNTLKSTHFWVLFSLSQLKTVK